MKTEITFTLRNIARLMRVFFILLTVLGFLPAAGFSQLSTVPVSNAQNDQVVPSMTSDGNGGTIIAWQDMKNGKYEIFAQRLNAGGTAMWTSNGIPICTQDSNYNPIIVSDNNGGAIISWQSYRGSATADIYAQRVNAEGDVLWAVDGLPVSEVVFDQNTISMISDGFNGAVLTWQDYRSNNGFADIYAQRIASDGSMLWTANGVSICNQAAEQGAPKLVSDGFGGAFITWHDARAGDFDIYTQLISAGGAVQWTTNGAATCTMATDQLKPDVCSDGAGGAIITWYDFRSTTDYNIYAQRQGPAGAIVWVVDGIVMNNNVAYNQTDPQIISDGMAGAIISWTDYRTGITSDIYAQRVSTTGEVQWTATGVTICTEAGDQINSQLVSDGNSGAYITWEDHRNKGNSDIYAQRIASDAALNWAATGYAINTSENNQMRPRIVSNGDMGAVVVWQDLRNGNDFDIYALGFNTSGIIADVPVLLSPSDSATAQPLNVTLDWSDVVSAETYSVQVSTDPGFKGTLVNISGLDSSSFEMGKGLITGTTYYWRASASNIGGTSAYSAPFSFTTLSEIPLAPELVSPINGAFNQPLSLDLDWNDALNADTYDLQVSSDSSFTGVILDQTGLDSSGFSIAPAILSNYTNYHWRVRSTNKAGSSSYSDAFSFRTIIASPNVPVLVLPLNGASNISTTPFLSWKPVDSAISYNVYISSDSKFADTVLMVNGVVSTGYTVETQLSENLTYYWKVSAANKGGNGEYSEAYSFTTVSPAPAAPLLLTPEYGQKGIALSPAFDWNDVGSGNFYELQLSHDSAFTDTLSIVSGLKGSEYTLADTLNQGTMHYWRVRTYSKSDSSEWSDIWQFTTTFLTGFGNNGGVIPSEFTLYQNYPNPFNPSTKIKFDIPQTSRIQNGYIKIYNLLGQTVALLFQGQLTAGVFEMQWDASKMPSGIYFYELKTDDFRSIKRMTLIK